MKGELEVLKGGLLTTVQDGGRHGFRKYGVPVSGVMDEHSYKLANWLVGNSEDAPVLELTLTGGTFKFNSDAIVGISGAPSNITVGGEPVILNKTFSIKEGQILEIGSAKSGCRVYLAIAGDWDVEKIMGSYATCIAAKFGGKEGRALEKGDTLRWVFDEKNVIQRSVPKKLLPHYSSRQTIRIIEGPELDIMNEDEKKEFLKTNFQISSQSNRMGIRLEAELMVQINSDEMVSSAVVPGIVQLPASGKPLLLMKDAQSVGGYPRIAKVIDADLWRLGQMWTKNTICFELVSVKKALRLAINYNKLITELKPSG